LSAAQLSTAQLTADKQMLAASRNVYIKKIIKYSGTPAARFSQSRCSKDNVLEARAGSIELANK
jgi:hypothetical protein